MFAKPKSSRPGILVLGVIVVLGTIVWARLTTQSKEARKAQIHKQVVAQIDAKVNARKGYCAAEHIHKHTEYVGNVVTQARNTKGQRIHTTRTAEECCWKCQAKRGCNEWVWCHEPEKCGNECWLKREANHDKVPQPGNNPAVIWTSGLIPKNFDVDPATLPPLDKSISHLVLTTQFGKINIELKPDWSPTSVEYVQRLAQQPELCGPECQFYRAEPGFLLQGALRGYIPANNVTKEGPKLMERGEIGWAGGGPGPDFFIYVDKNPAQHFGLSHTVWGKLADEASMAVVERIIQQPTSQSTPGGMRMMDTRVDINTARAAK